MNQGYSATAYFNSETDARRAAEDLRAQGCEVDVRSESSHGQSFWDSIKNFFSGEQNTDQYRTGAVLTITGGDTQTVRTVVQQYSGRMGDTADTSVMGTSNLTGTSKVTGTSSVAGAGGGLGTTGAGLGTTGAGAATTGAGAAASGTGGIPPSTTGEIDDTDYIGGAGDDLERARTGRTGDLGGTGINRTDIDDRGTI